MFRLLHRAIAIFLSLIAAVQAAEVVNLGVPELAPADMYDFTAISKAKQKLEAKGWTP